MCFGHHSSNMSASLIPNVASGIFAVALGSMSVRDARGARRDFAACVIAFGVFHALAALVPPHHARYVGVLLLVLAADVCFLAQASSDLQQCGASALELPEDADAPRCNFAAFCIAWLCCMIAGDVYTIAVHM